MCMQVHAPEAVEIMVTLASTGMEEEAFAVWSWQHTICH